MIETIEELEALYGTPKKTALVKVADRITAEYRVWIEAAPFCALASVGADGLDCSPRGDEGQVVVVVDDKTLDIPDRHGNNRIDSLRNIIRDPRISLMFLVPGSATVIRVNGRAGISAEPELLARYETHGKKPRSVLRITVQEVYFQCSRAVMRAGLWGGAEAPALPTPGRILAAMSEGEVGGEDYDREWPERAKRELW